MMAAVLRFKELGQLRAALKLLNVFVASDCAIFLKILGNPIHACTAMRDKDV
jgi:hypothetical protein